MNRLNNQSGFTLIELMIVLTLSLFLMLAVIQIFSANSQNFRFSIAFSRMQENGRLALDELARDIRMAGFFGCASRQQITINSVASNNPPNMVPAQHIIGFDGGTDFNSIGASIVDSRARTLTLCDNARGNTNACRISDVLQIIRGAETIGVTTSTMSSPSDTISVSSVDMSSLRPSINTNGTPPNEEDLVVITDCQQADLFRTNAISSTTLTPNANLQKAYSSDSFVMPIVGATYFVATDNRDKNGDGEADEIATLYRIGIFDENVAPSAVPIARGIESLQIQYGENTQGDEFADVYRNSAASVSDFTKVVSIRIGILLKSEQDFLTDAPIPVTFMGESFNNGDRRLRLQMFTTIGLRNRVP